MMNKEPLPSDAVTGDGVLLERLKRLHNDSKAIRESFFPEAGGVGSDVTPEFTADFIHLASIAKIKAKTEAFNSHRSTLVDSINAFVIVPNDVMPDANKNEIDLSSFVRRYIPEAEWPRFIAE